MPSFQAKNSTVSDRQLKVQEVCIPLRIVGNATSADVAVSNDEPGMLFLATEGVDQITAALEDGETATFSASPADATGIFQALVKISEPVSKVVCAQLVRRDAASGEYAYLGSSTGVTTGDAGGEKIMILCDSSLNLTSATLDACLRVAYIVE